jgi:TATA-binding protein-associated factor Taf7
MEEQFILRLPSSLASILLQELAETAFEHPGEGFGIKWLSPRTALVRHPRFVKGEYPAVLMDLPGICETLKSSNLTSTPKLLDEDEAKALEAKADETKDKERDKDTDKEKEKDKDKEKEKDNGSATLSASGPSVSVAQYYKVADVSQALVVLDVESPEGAKQFKALPSSIQQRLMAGLSGDTATDPSRFACPDETLATCPWAQLADGLTPPLKQAAKRRFGPRPLHFHDAGDLERIEREVERLIKADGQAAETAFSLLGADGQVLLSSGPVATETLHEDTEMEPYGEGDMALEQDEEDNELEGDEEEDEEEEEDNNEEEGSGEEEGEGEEFDDFAAELEDNLMQEQEFDGSQLSAGPTEAASLHDPSAALSGLSEKDRMVYDLEERLEEKRKQAASVANPLIKARIEDVVRQLEDNLRHLKQSAEE